MRLDTKTTHVMKHYWLIVWICLLGLPTVSGQMLWKVEGKERQTPSYLFGTIHLGHPQAYTFSDQALKALAATDGMAGELVFDPAAIFKVMSKVMMKDSTLRDLLPPEKYALVHEKITERLGMIAPMAERMQPAFVSVLLMEQEEGTTADLGEAPQRTPLDLYLQEQARKQNKDVRGLETVEEQMDAFASMSLKMQAEALYEAVQANEKSSGQLQQMLDLYEKGELDTLYQLAIREMPPQTAERFLDQRNQRMTERMMDMLKEKSWFVAVGAAHLPGEQGMIALLRKAGYTVIPISD